MQAKTYGRRAAILAVVAVASLAATSQVTATAAPEPTGYPGRAWAPGPEQYGVLAERLVMVPMDDGAQLRADIFWPTDPATGQQAPGPFPVLLTQTPYSANLGLTNNVQNAGEFFVRRGYIVVQADQRGTGLSGGAEWDVFGTRAGRDGAALAFWAAQLPRSTGDVGLFGCSAMGISQLATAIELGRTYGTNHPVRAMVPGCISGGMYRDTYLDNGIPGLTVPLAAAEPVTAADRLPLVLAEGGQPRLQGAEILTGGDMAYERGFWQERKWSDGGADIVRSGIPALVYVAWGEGGHIGGLELYAELQNAAAGRNPLAPMRRGQRVTARYQLLIGQGGHGCCLADPGVQLQWFEHWLRGVDTGLSLNTRTPMHIQELGSGRYVNAATYPFTDDYTALRLGPATLGAGAPANGFDSLVWAPPVDGVSSRSYDMAALADGATLAGPMSATIYASSSNTNLELAAAVYDVAPDGTAVEISHGSLVASLSELDPSRSWTDVDGHTIRPYGRFDYDRYRLPGVVQRYDINIAPKLYSIAPGHHLRLTLASQWGPDVCGASAGIGPAPYGCFPTAPQLRTLAGGQYQVLRTAAHPSALNVPLLPYEHFPTIASAPTPTSEGTVIPIDWG